MRTFKSFSRGSRLGGPWRCQKSRFAKGCWGSPYVVDIVEGSYRFGRGRRCHGSIECDRRTGSSRNGSCPSRDLQQCAQSFESDPASTMAIKRCPESPLMIAAVASLLTSERKTEKADSDWNERYSNGSRPPRFLGAVLCLWGGQWKGCQRNEQDSQTRRWMNKLKMLLISNGINQDNVPPKPDWKWLMSCILHLLLKSSLRNLAPRSAANGWRRIYPYFIIRICGIVNYKQKPLMSVLA